MGNLRYAQCLCLQASADHNSPYFPSPGFGANEYPLPPGANITQVQGLSRHGSRYPASGSGVQSLGQKIQNLTSNGTAKFTGELAFLNTFKYSLGAEILVPQGRAELYNHGVLQYYAYGRLYNPSTKIIIRSTTQDRMVESAEQFASGFFGRNWLNNATLELSIDQIGYNNSLAGYNQCNNSNLYVSDGGDNASDIWEATYLKNAQARFNALGNYNWSISDVYNAQTSCPYETIAFGYSAFCDLFTYQEWKDFEYSLDLQFDGTYGFAAPAGRAIGIGWVEEFYARLQGHLYNLPAGSTQVNTTLDEMNSTFPLNQTLSFDFTHDVNIAAVVTALGLTQFNQTLSANGPPANQQMIVSHTEPFGSRLIFEVIKTPQPVKANRPATANATTSDYYDAGNATTYIHLTLNQRTIPLNASYPQCGAREDGWCEITTFTSILSGLLATAEYDYACFGNYPNEPFGNITNGVQPQKRDIVGRVLGGGMGSGISIQGTDSFLDRR